MSRLIELAGENIAFARKPRTVFDLHIGSRIRECRKSRKMTDAVLAYAVGVSPQQLSKYESGKNRVSASMLANIAVALAVHPGWFFEMTPDPVYDVRRAIPHAFEGMQR